MRIGLIVGLLLCVGTTNAAHAKRREVVKAEYKKAKKDHKKVGKYADKWITTKEKGKNPGKWDEKLNPYYAAELEWLRAKGIDTKLDAPVSPIALKEGEINEFDVPKLRTLRDITATLKRTTPPPAEKKVLLRRYVAILEDRLRRKEKAWFAEK